MTIQLITGDARDVLPTVCKLRPGERCAICGAIGARSGIEAQHGLNDTFPGDPYPKCGSKAP